MDFSKALSLSLGELPEPVVTRFRLGVILWQLHEKRAFKGERIERIRGDFATSAAFDRHLAFLEDSGILKQHPDLGTAAYRLLGRKESDPAEVACTVDPFCYLSHLSAMAHHGLTDRLPVRLFLSSPTPQDWKREAEAKMEKELGENKEHYREAGFPLLTAPRFRAIDGMEVHSFHSKHRGAYKNIKGKTLRVSTMGRTFLDMLRNPELCGGIRHVIEVFREHAATYLRLVVDELEQHGAPIDKVRAGYLLDEECGLKNSTVESWKKFAQRGGSRKLDASAEYRPVWSDKWCLSLNI